MVIAALGSRCHIGGRGPHTVPYTFAGIIPFEEISSSLFKPLTVSICPL
jgi:hypothetical protein